MKVIYKAPGCAPEPRDMAIKEALAMFLEQWGDAKVVEITEATPEQLKID